jgi:hypothetical protein
MAEDRPEVFQLRSLSVLAPEILAYLGGAFYDTVLLHPLPDPPDKWKEKFTNEPGMGTTISSDVQFTQEHGTPRDPYNCNVTTVTGIACIANKDFVEPFQTVIIVQQVPAGGASAGVTVGPVGGSGSKPNFNWAAYKYRIGTGYHYEFRVTYKVITKSCEPMTKNSYSLQVVKGEWVLASVNKNEIIPPPELVAGPFALQSEATKVADSQREPKINGVKKENKAAGLVDE